MKRHNIRCKNTGKFVSRSTSSPQIVNGRLYKFNGVIVRARKKCSNGLRLVSLHKKLNGFASDDELQPIDKQEVQQYLNKV